MSQQPQQPHSSTVKVDEMARLMDLRDHFVSLATRGRFNDAASREWRRLPANWRMGLLLIAGVGLDADNLSDLADRDWLEMPPPERAELRSVVRSAKKHLGALVALAAKV